MGWTEQDQCLGFLNDQGEWECEDPCLESKGDQLCGQTTHFTNFALLLGGAAGATGCGSGNFEYTLTYLSVGFIGGALLCILVAMILIEIRFRFRARHRSVKRRSHVQVTHMD